MEINNGDVTVALPESLAKLLLNNGKWEEGSAEVEDDRVEGRVEDDIALPMTHIPGVVAGISMNRLKKLVADGTVPHVLKDRTKLVKPSDVRAVLKQENENV